MKALVQILEKNITQKQVLDSYIPVVSSRNIVNGIIIEKTDQNIVKLEKI